MGEIIETVIIIVVSILLGIGLQDEYNLTNKLPQVTIEYVDRNTSVVELLEGENR